MVPAAMLASTLIGASGDFGGDPFEIGAHDCVILRVLQQKGIVPMRGVDLGVAHAPARLQKRLHDLAAALGGKAPVGGKRSDKK